MKFEVVAARDAAKKPGAQGDQGSQRYQQNAIAEEGPSGKQGG